MALESPTHLSIGRNIGGVTKLFDADSNSYPVKFRQTFTDASHRGVSPAPALRPDFNNETCKMSSTFEEVLKNYTKDPSDGIKPESRVDRIMDVFRRGESMLLSTDNMRPKSRCKTSLRESDFLRKTNSSSLERPSSLTHSLKPQLISQISPNNVNDSNLQIDKTGHISNVTNNADSVENVTPTKGKKYRKRAKSEGKSKRHRQGKPPIQPPAKYPSTPSVFSQSNSHVSRRISCEPTSKHSNGSTVSHTMQDVMKKYEYVPSMADIRSQRAVKGRLQVIEKNAQQKKEKQKESAAKLEKQQMKDREKILKAKQRKEIYALNKIMTELEHKRFLEFCHSKGLNKT